jgi:hypothetical protein
MALVPFEIEKNHDTHFLLEWHKGLRHIDANGRLTVERTFVFTDATPDA